MMNMGRDLEGIMLSEIDPTEKDKHCMMSLICGIKKKKTRRNEEWNGGYQAMGELGRYWSKGTNFRFKDE